LRFDDQPTSLHVNSVDFLTVIMVQQSMIVHMLIIVGVLFCLLHALYHLLPWNIHTQTLCVSQNNLCGFN